MQLVERHIIISDKNVESICNKSALLYNYALYNLRQVYFGKLQKFSEYELTGLFAEFKQEDYVALPAQTAQQTIKLLFKNWKSFWASIKDYKKNPSKYSGRPSLPKYKNGNKLSSVRFTSQQVKLKNGYIHFPKATNLSPLKTKVANIDQVRITPQATCFIIEVVYTKPEEKNENLKAENIMSIDLGLNNLATCVTNVGQPFIVNGKPLKAINQFYNKEKAKLQGFVGNLGTSKRLTILTRNRNNLVENYIHKASRIIIDRCVEDNIGTIVVGKNVGWKDEINIGSANNQKFTSIPHAKFIEKIEYKAKMAGIEVKIHEEAYTSKIDHFAEEEMKHQEKYLGKRIKRGLFQSSIGKLLNADVNGAIGIARKVFGNSFVKMILDRGLAFNPVRINVV